MPHATHATRQHAALASTEDHAGQGPMPHARHARPSRSMLPTRQPGAHGMLTTARGRAMPATGDQTTPASSATRHPAVQASTEDHAGQAPMPHATHATRQHAVLASTEDHAGQALMPHARHARRNHSMPPTRRPGAHGIWTTARGLAMPATGDPDLLPPVSSAALSTGTMAENVSVSRTQHCV